MPLPGYAVSLGPLSFECAVDTITETLGEALENVGAVVTPAEPRPRAFKLTLPLRGLPTDPDMRATGLRLRRQVRQLLENPRWRNQPLYFHWTADPELDCWLRIGGGDVTESEQGSLAFGDWRLELTDCYIAGRPARSRNAMRLELADRRDGQVAHDTRGLIYAATHAAEPLPPAALILPGQSGSILRTGGRSATLADYEADARYYAVNTNADGEVASYMPSIGVGVGTSKLPDHGKLGSVRAWNATASTIPLIPNTVGELDAIGYTADANADPTLMGWEQLYGDPAPNPTAEPLSIALDNGITRVIWLNGYSKGGLAVENIASGAGARVLRLGFVAVTIDRPELNLLELSPERAVFEVRVAARSIRVILQRGWPGPRIESYNDDGGTAQLHVAIDKPTGTPGIFARPASGRPWLYRLDAGTDAANDDRALLASATSDLAVSVSNLAARVVSLTSGYQTLQLGRTRALAAQLLTTDMYGLGLQHARPTDRLAGLAVADARSIPTLATR